MDVFSEIRPDTWTHASQLLQRPRVVLEQAFKHLASGGYLEMQDADFPMHAVDDSLAGTALWKWNMCMVDGASKAGRP